MVTGRFQTENEIYLIRLNICLLLNKIMYINMPNKFGRMPIMPN